MIEVPYGMLQVFFGVTSGSVHSVQYQASRSNSDRDMVDLGALLWVLVASEDLAMWPPGLQTPEPEAGTCCQWARLHLARTNTPESDPVLTK